MVLDGKFFLNKITGEIVSSSSKKLAYAYFKADGKIVGYKVRWFDVVRYKR